MIINEHAKLEIITKSNKEYNVAESDIIEKSLTTTQSCSSGGGIPAGSCNAGTLSASFRAPPGMAKKDLFMAKIKLYVWYGAGVPEQRGEYNVTSSTKNGNVYTISASDNIVLLDESCYSAKDVQDAENGLIEILENAVRDPATILSFICNTYDVPHLNHDENVEKVPDSGDIKLCTSVSSECSTESVKDFAYYIAEYLGAFIVADENGKIRFCRLGDREPDIEINLSNIASGTYQRSPYYVFPAMWRVCFDSGFSNYWYASPVPGDAAPFSVDVINNPFWQYQEDVIPSDLYAGKTTDMIFLPWDYIYNAATDENGKPLINPFSATVYVPYLFRVCDLVTITDPDTNEKYRTYITDVTWTFRGGQTISCAGEDTRTLSVSKSRSAAKRGTDYSKYLYRKSKKSIGSSNTTYKLTKTDHTISLKGSDGSESSVTIPGNEITVDDALSDTSENPVQNKVISNEIKNLKRESHTHENKEVLDSITAFDTAPAKNSTNPVTSSGIYTAIARSRANITAVSVDAEVTADMWQDGAVTITSSEIHAGSVVTVGLQMGAAAADLVQAAGNALIVAKSQTEGNITLECLGKIPAVTIPITLTILTDTSYAVIQTIAFTVQPSDWADSTVTLTDANFLPDSIADIGLQVGTATAEIAKAAANATIAAQSQTDGAITLVCLGTVPAVALPLAVTVINVGG